MSQYRKVLLVELDDPNAPMISHGLILTFYSVRDVDEIERYRELLLRPVVEGIVDRMEEI